MKRLFLLLLFLMVAGRVEGATFGNSGSGDLWQTMSTNVAYVSEFTLSEAGSVSKLTALTQYTDGTAKMKGLIFSKSGTEPATLLGVTNETTISAGDNWTDFPFATNIELSAGTYFIGVIESSGNCRVKVYYELTGSNTKEGSNNAGTPTNWGSTSYTENNRAESIYATYTAGGGSTATFPKIILGE